MHSLAVLDQLTEEERGVVLGAVLGERDAEARLAPLQRDVRQRCLAAYRWLRGLDRQRRQQLIQQLTARVVNPLSSDWQQQLKGDPAALAAAGCAPALRWRVCQLLYHVARRGEPR